MRRPAGCRGRRGQALHVHAIALRLQGRGEEEEREQAVPGLSHRHQHKQHARPFRHGARGGHLLRAVEAGRGAWGGAGAAGKSKGLLERAGRRLRDTARRRGGPCARVRAPRGPLQHWGGGDGAQAGGAPARGGAHCGHAQRLLPGAARGGRGHQRSSQGTRARPHQLRGARDCSRRRDGGGGGRDQPPRGGGGVGGGGGGGGDRRRRGRRRRRGGGGGGGVHAVCRIRAQTQD